MRHAADIVIVGSGHGGAQAAISLRQNGFAGSILLIGREQELPYERPPLSKDYLSGGKPFERLLIRPATFWAERNIDMWLGREVVQVDPRAGEVRLSDGSAVAYVTLIWAAGGDPRKLSCDGSELVGVHAVRTRADVDQLIAELEGGARRVAIVGGGYIGLEAAAVLTKLGRDVTLLEALPRVLARVAGEALSAFYQEEHLAHGVDLRTNARISHLVGSEGRVSGVAMADGAVVPADLVIVGIGVAPNVGPLLEAGAQGTQQLGVQVDAQCRTSLVNVFAIGDCAAHTSVFAGGDVVRIESVQNANDMASLVAKVICGHEQVYAATPWFWSNQYDLKLQTVGLSMGHDEVVVRGDPEKRAFSVVYLRQGRVIALDCVNRVKDYVQGRTLVEAGARISSSRLKEDKEQLGSMC